jgi:K+-sensing histidine kinase KdpD
VTPRGGLTRDRVALLAALAGPPAVCAALAPFRTDFSNTDATLVLVLVVVAVAADGYRVAGVLSALSAGLAFDFFLTRPYQSLAIERRDDVATTVLLLLVGIAVTELAVWGRRRAADASREAGYLAGVLTAAETAATGGSPTTLIGEVCEQMTNTLGLRGCRFHHGTGRDHPRLRHDGQVVWRGAVWDVSRAGLPTGTEVELLVESGGRFRGRFLLDAIEGSRPSLAQRLAVVALADQVGAALGGYAADHAPREP